MRKSTPLLIAQVVRRAKSHGGIVALENGPAATYPLHTIDDSAMTSETTPSDALWAMSTQRQDMGHRFAQ